MDEWDIFMVVAVKRADATKMQSEMSGCERGKFIWS